MAYSMSRTFDEDMYYHIHPANAGERTVWRVMCIKSGHEPRLVGAFASASEAQVLGETLAIQGGNDCGPVIQYG
jgi:hypothetical protein